MCKEGEKRVDDLNMSIHASSPGENIVLGIVTSSMMWLTDKTKQPYTLRELHGAELLCLQGWAVKDQKISYSHEQMRDLVGNAFCAFTLTPILIALLTLLDWRGMNAAKREQKALGEASGVEEGSGDDDVNEEELEEDDEEGERTCSDE